MENKIPDELCSDESRLAKRGGRLFDVKIIMSGIKSVKILGNVRVAEGVCSSKEMCGKCKMRFWRKTTPNLWDYKFK